MNRPQFKRVWILSSFLYGFGLMAQVDTGTIRGTITDVSSKVVPGAKVSITQEETNLTLTTQAGPEGSYLFTPVRVGTYTVTAAYTGFETVIRSKISLHVQQNLVVDLVLSPGQVTTKTEVTGEAPLLQTEDASVGQVVASREINMLPLNGRNYTLLAQLTPGVTTAAQESRGLAASGTFVANGVPSL